MKEFEYLAYHNEKEYKFNYFSDFINTMRHLLKHSDTNWCTLIEKSIELDDMEVLINQQFVFMYDKDTDSVLFIRISKLVDLI